MSSDYLRTYAQSADANAFAEAAPLTSLQKELIAKVDERGVTWAERAFQHDRDASFPTENFKDLKDMGFLGLCLSFKIRYKIFSFEFMSGSAKSLSGASTTSCCIVSNLQVISSCSSKKWAFIFSSFVLVGGGLASCPHF